VSTRNAAMLAAALDYAQHHWEVFPLRGKLPAIPKRIGGRGLIDATADIDQITEWWSGEYVGANIGGRVPASMFVVDVDPYHDGLDTLAEHERRHGKLPETLTDVSGRGDGGSHLFFRRPPGKLIGTRLGAGLDLRTHGNYVVLPPSTHPDTGNPYTRIEAPVAAPPAWLVELLAPAKPAKTAHRITPGRPRSSIWRRLGGSIADDFSANTSWAEILEPHGWTRTADDTDGTRWLHPTATSKCSATVSYGCLFVWSPNTPFDQSAAGDRHGYKPFRAYAVLNYGGDMSAAARSLRGGQA
jgi:hypothetical protein